MSKFRYWLVEVTINEDKYKSKEVEDILNALQNKMLYPEQTFHFEVNNKKVYL